MVFIKDKRQQIFTVWEQISQFDKNIYIFIVYLDNSILSEIIKHSFIRHYMNGIKRHHTIIHSDIKRHQKSLYQKVKITKLLKICPSECITNYVFKFVGPIIFADSWIDYLLTKSQYCLEH